MLLSSSPHARREATLRRTGSPRSWRVPPALFRSPNAPETLEGERILGEFPGHAGLLLWQCYRDVRLWEGTPPELRAGLFHRPDPGQLRELMEAARLNPGTLRAIRTLHASLRRSEDDDGSIVSAALTIAAAAERVGAPATAVAYTQLASAAVPSAPGPAFAVGRVAVRLGHHGVAETWLRRAISLARRSREWDCQGAALIELGRLREKTGLPREARTEYWRAFRLARRRGLHAMDGPAVSGLLRIALLEGDDVAAELYAKSALRLHGRNHPDRGSVLLDVAEVELRRSRHRRATVLLEEALRTRTEPFDQVRALTKLVRAAGGDGNRAAVQEAWHRATGLIDAFGSGGAGARLLLGLARAGAEVLEDTQADVAAYRALLRATAARDPALVDECSAFLSRTRLPRSDDPGQATAAPSPGHEDAASSAETARILCDAASLRGTRRYP